MSFFYSVNEQVVVGFSQVVGEINFMPLITNIALMSGKQKFNLLNKPSPGVLWHSENGISRFSDPYGNTLSYFVCACGKGFQSYDGRKHHFTAMRKAGFRVIRK